MNKKTSVICIIAAVLLILIIFVYPPYVKIMGHWYPSNIEKIEIDCYSKNAHDIVRIKKLKKLKELKISSYSGNELSSSISELSNLESLRLYACDTDLNCDFKNLEKLEKISLLETKCSFSSKMCDSINYIYMCDSTLISIEGLKSCKCKELYINRIDGVTDDELNDLINTLPEIEYLRTDIAYLKNKPLECKSLKRVALFDNVTDIKESFDIDRITDCSSINELQLILINISDYSPLCEMKNLKTLKVYSEQISEEDIQLLENSGIKVEVELPR